MFGQWVKFIIFSVFVVILSFNFLSQERIVDLKYLKADECIGNIMPSSSQLLFKEIEKYQLINNRKVLPARNFKDFSHALGFKESQNRYHVVNPYGYMGKYQFGSATLSNLGISDTLHFLQSPDLQEKAFVAYISCNKWILRRDIMKYNGTVINGVEVTESGILAAAHLAGPGSVKKYLKTNGEQRFRDANGASILKYMKKFGGYDISAIPAKKSAKVFKA